jgi:hypothetical protein
MKKTLLLLLAIKAATANAQEGLSDSASVNPIVRNFIAAIKHHDTNKIARMMSFPFSREYPIPAIKNRKELGKRYGELFDENLVNLISRSDPNNDWSAVGWRGIMLQDGAVWLGYDDKLLAVNYQSAAEKKMLQQLVGKEKDILHASLRQYKEPVHILETKKYRIRIDKLSNGKYRYASWKLDTKMSEQPDLVINNGVVEFDGSGGNHHYTFTNNGYTYICEIVILGGNNDAPAVLHLLKAEKEILTQKAKIVKK